MPITKHLETKMPNPHPNILSSLDYIDFLRAGLILGVGIFLAKFVSASLQKIFLKRWSAHQCFIWRRISFYSILLLFIISALRQLGFDLQVLLGAAGILTVAFGFASQTSASNLISGLFLMIERSFIVGDRIVVNNTEGEVLSIDLLSVKLLKGDNTYVRIPNEVLIKTQLINLTRFPLRRVDVNLTVTYQQDCAQVRKTLFKLTTKNPLCLTTPEPIYAIQGFTSDGVHVQFSVWTSQANWQELKTQIHEQIAQAFTKQQINFAYPYHLVIKEA
jgi:small-conductance mechanosensitive channel